MRLLVSVVCLLTTVLSPCAGQGSTRHLKHIFQGRCYDYKLNRVDNPLPGVEVGCRRLWTLFRNAFAYQPSCGLDEKNYVPFLKAAAQDLPADKSLFWSGTSDLVHRLSQEGQEYVTMEDTLIGYLVDSLSWCGQQRFPGIDYIECPEWGSCEGDANSIFWDASSTLFAQQASGEVSVLLDGSNPDRPAYREDSFFASVELPNLDTDRVTTVNVQLVHRLGQPHAETCNNGSLVTLQRDVTARGFHFTCEENPDNVLHLLCVDEPDALDCQKLCIVAA